MNNTPNMAERPVFIKRQYEFSAHIRDPRNNPAPSDVEKRRMKIYNELFYNNVEGFMSNSYPVLQKILGKKAWHAMIHDYFSLHRAQTPLFSEMPREFLKYLENEREIQHTDPAFLLELAHYEWVELALSILDCDNDVNSVDPNGDLLDAIPVMSSLAWPLSYHFPVHKISPEFQPPQTPEQLTHLVVYRNLNESIVFMEVNSVTARLLQLITDSNQYTGNACMRMIATELKHPDADVVIAGGLQTLQQLRDRNIILGTQK